MPKRPDFVDIAGVQWSIHWLTEEEWVGSDERDIGNSGETLASQFSIWVRVSDHLDDLAVREVFLHELMHACLGATGHTYLYRYIKKKDQEEMLISGLSPALLAVFRNNPEVLAYIVED